MTDIRKDNQTILDEIKKRVEHPNDVAKASVTHQTKAEEWASLTAQIATLTATTERQRRRIRVLVDMLDEFMEEIVTGANA